MAEINTTSEETKAAIAKTSEETKAAIKRKTAFSLPNAPSSVGYTPDEIKKAFYTPITDDTNSVLAELDRIVDEANTALSAAESYADKAINKIGLIAVYTMEPSGSIDDIKVGYKNSFAFEYFNRTPLVGDVFFCHGVTRTDSVSFHMTAEVTGIVEREDGGKNAAFEAIEVLASGAASIGLIPLCTLEPNTTIDHITAKDANGNPTYRDSFAVENFNRRPVKNDTFFGYGRTIPDKVSFHIMARMTGEFATANGREYAAFEALEVVASEVDKEYDPESDNPQSGKAVAQALDELVGDIGAAIDELKDYANGLIGGAG